MKVSKIKRMGVTTTLMLRVNLRNQRRVKITARRRKAKRRRRPSDQTNFIID